MQNIKPYNIFAGLYIFACMLLVGCDPNTDSIQAATYIQPENISRDISSLASSSGGQYARSGAYSTFAAATPAPEIFMMGQQEEDILLITATPESDMTSILSFGASSSLTPTPIPEDTPAPEDVLILSSTPEPAATPSPSATPTPKLEYELKTVKNEKGHVKAHDVNLREGPGEEYDIIQKVEYLTSVVITGKTDNWYRLEFDGIEGFMAKTYVALGAEPTPAPTPRATATPKVTPKPIPEPEEDITPEAEGTPAPQTTPDAQIPQGNTGSYSDEDIYLAAKLIYAEGKNQTTESFLAMANVLYYRCQSNKFGGGMTSVATEVYRSSQFTVVKYDSFAGLVPSDAALSAAREVFQNGMRTLPEGVMYFRSASKGKDWGSKRVFYKTIGGNNYYY